MKILDEAAISGLLDLAALIDHLKQALAGPLEAPPRAHIDLPGRSPSTLLIMPAWRPSHSIGVKIVTVDSARSHLGHFAVNGIYVVLDPLTSDPVAVLGARTLTAARTAAVAALASSCLSRPEAETLLTAGTGTLVPYLIRAHASVRPIRHILLWGRDQAKATQLATRLGSELPHLRFSVAQDLAAAAASADLISCATASSEPFLPTDAIRPGTHIDLIGSFKPGMKEIAPTLLARARVYVDQKNALRESGDLIPALEAGLLDPSQVCDLRTLITHPEQHRPNSDTITIFKAVGMAVADLAAAEFFLQRAKPTSPGALHAD